MSRVERGTEGRASSLAYFYHTDILVFTLFLARISTVIIKVVIETLVTSRLTQKLEVEE